jgi:hypothetical protein
MLISIEETFEIKDMKLFAIISNLYKLSLKIN